MIQESPGHALTGVFTWTAARLNGTKSGSRRLAGSENENAMRKLKTNAGPLGLAGYWLFKKRGSESSSRKLFNISEFLVAGVGFEPTTFGL